MPKNKNTLRYIFVKPQKVKIKKKKKKTETKPEEDNTWPVKE